MEHYGTYLSVKTALQAEIIPALLWLQTEVVNDHV